MRNIQFIKQDEANTPLLEAGLEEKLLASQLVSEVRKNPGHFSFTLTDLGVIEFARAMQLAATEEAMETKQDTKSIFPDKDGDFISKKDVLTGFAISHTTLWKWQKSGYLTPVKVGKKIYYRREDIKSLTQK